MEYAVSIVTTKKNTNARKMDVCACLIAFGEMALRASLSAKKRRNKLIINELRRFFIEWLIKICATFQLEVQQTSLSR